MKIPTYDGPQVQQQVTPGGRLSPDIPAGAFGQGLAQGLGQLGQSIGEAQKEEDERVLERATTDLVDAKTDLKQNKDIGYVNKVGDAAKGITSQYTGMFDKNAENVAKMHGITSGPLKVAWDRRVSMMKTAFRTEVEEHEGKNAVLGDLNAADKKIKSAQAAYHSNFMSPGQYELSRLEINTAADQIKALTGKDVKDHAMAQLLVSQIMGFYRGDPTDPTRPPDPSAALTILKDKSAREDLIKGLGVEGYDSIMEVVSKGAKSQTTAAFVDEVVANGWGPEKIDEVVRSRFKDATARKDAMAALRDRRAFIEAGQKDREDAILASVSDALGPNANDFRSARKLIEDLFVSSPKEDKPTIQKAMEHIQNRERQMIEWGRSGSERLSPVDEYKARDVLFSILYNPNLSSMPESEIKAKILTLPKSMASQAHAAWANVRATGGAKFKANQDLLKKAAFQAGLTKEINPKSGTPDAGLLIDLEASAAEHGRGISSRLELNEKDQLAFLRGLASTVKTGSKWFGLKDVNEPIYKVLERVPESFVEEYKAALPDATPVEVVNRWIEIENRQKGAKSEVTPVDTVAKPEEKPKPEGPTVEARPTAIEEVGNDIKRAGKMIVSAVTNPLGKKKKKEDK